MLDKKEIGRKIWELFSKNHTYSQIAQELNISKSVVSNVINYSLPAHTWIWEDLKELKQKHEQELQEKETQIKKLKKQLKEKKEEYEDLQDENNNLFIITLITLSIYIIVTAIILYFVKINFYYNVWYTLGFMVYSIVSLIAIFFAVAYARANEWI